MSPEAELQQPEFIEPQPEPQDQAPETQPEAPEGEQLIDGRWKSQAEKEIYQQGQKDAVEFLNKRQAQMARQQAEAERVKQIAASPDPMEARIEEQAKVYLAELQQAAQDGKLRDDPAAPFTHTFKAVLKAAVKEANIKAQEMVDTRLGGFVQRLNAEDRSRFIRENPQYAPYIDKITDMVENQGVNIADLTFIMDDLMKKVPKVQPKREVDYSQPQNYRTGFDENEGFMESPTATGASPSSKFDPKKTEADLVKAIRDGDEKGYQQHLRKWIANTQPSR